MYTLEVQVDDANGGTDMAEVRIQVVTVPDAPTGLMATAVSDTQIDLAWEAPTRTGGAGLTITRYEVEFSTDGTNFTDLYTTYDGSTFSYSHTGLSAGTTYHYRVAAVNSAGTTGAYASTSTATMEDSGGGGNAPEAPTSFVATAVSATQIDLSWQAPSDTGGASLTITNYKIESSTNGTTFTDLDMTNGTTTTYAHTGLTAGTTYHYQVAAVNSAGTTGAYARTSDCYDGGLRRRRQCAFEAPASFSG